MTAFTIDAVAYLTLAGLAFGMTVVLHRTVLGVVRFGLERFLFWGVWVSMSVLFAGIYHVLTGDVVFGRALEILALCLILCVVIGINGAAAVMFRKPYDPLSDPEFLADYAERRRLRDERWQAAIGTTWTAEIEQRPEPRRLLR